MARSGALPHHLPAPLSSLIGREQDLADVAAALAATRLLTLTGPGGVGKTRLANEVAARAGDEVWWIDLASVADPGEVESTLARALDVRPLPGLGELDAAKGFLWDKQALLVLDNCEHVAEEVAREVAALLTACASLTILATSRAPLGVEGETRWAVAPLPPADASRLFIDRAGRFDRGWALDGSGAWAVAEICRRLEGMPLALELAAARVVALSPETIARGLEDSLELLTARSAAGRHRTLRASLAWSHGLLPERARRLLRRLAVFAGGASLERAQEVCTGTGLEPGEVLAAIETLVEHSLVRVEPAGGVMRYRLLETVRQYALEQLDGAGERDVVRDRHRDAFLAFAERHRREALSPSQPAVFAALDPEAANLAAALDRALESDPAKALRLCLALDFWYRARARFREGAAAYARALGASDPPPALRARALGSWAWIVGNGGDFARANELATEAAAQAKVTGDDGAIAYTLLVLANHRFFTDPNAAVELLERCRELARATGDEYILLRSEALLRGTAWFRQDAPACREGLDQLRPRLERLGDRETLAWFWFEQGAVGYPLGEHVAAAALLTRAVDVAAEIGEPTADRAARAHLALLDVAAGRSQPALEVLWAIHAHTLVRGGSFAFPWIELLLAVAEAADGELAAARARLTTVVGAEAWGAAHALAWARAELAEVLRLAGEPVPAAEEAARALEAARVLHNPWLVAKAQLTLGRLAAQREAWTAAERTLHDALALIETHGLRLELPAALEALAAVAAGVESDTEAARTLAAAARARRDLGFVAWRGQCAETDALALRLRRPELEDAWSEGDALAHDGAVAWLRRARGVRKRPGHGWESLTPTEVAVVRLTAAGLTNPQIAEQLFIARATVKTHLSHVYAKLGVRNRSQLASEAAARLPPE